MRFKSANFIEIIANSDMIMKLAVFSINFLMFLSLTDAKEKDSLRLGVYTDLIGFLPAMELALKTIRNDETLPFTFNVTCSDSMCQASTAIRNFIGQIFSSSTDNQILLIGADCSVSTEPIAEIAPTWNLIQISPASSSPRLSNHKTFPNFIRTVSSDGAIVDGIIQAMKQYGWSRIALITQSENIFSFIATKLKKELAASKLRLIKEFTFNTEEHVTKVMESVRNSPARIIFLNMYTEHALEVVCKAYKNQMYHPTYAWMFFNWYLDNWWLANSSCVLDGSVEGESLEKVVINSLVFDHYPRIEEKRKEELNQGNITWNQYVTDYNLRFEELLEENNDTQPYIEGAAYMFDAMWTAALALNKTESRLNKKNLTLKNFTYEDEYNISGVIYEEILKVEFFGLTGNVSFLNNGDRRGKVRLLQYRRANNGSNLEKVEFAYIINGKLVYDSGEDDSTVFADGVAQDEEYFRITLPLFVIYTICSILGIIFATVCLVFNLWFRNHPLVKLGSPYVNAMTVVGAIVFYITVILFGVDENVASYPTVNGLCHTRIWLASIGFSLLYGTVLAKTWRVYYIFSYTKPNSKLEVKDIYLYGIVGVLIIADIIFLIPPTVVPNARLQREQKEFEGNKDNNLPAIVGVCTSNISLMWLSCLFVCKGFVLVAGLFLAFATRKVNIKPLNDSRFIAMSVYGIVIVSIALTPIGFSLQRYPSMQYGITGIMILLSTSLILGLLFVTKMYKVCQDPEGKQCMENSTVITNKAAISSETSEAYKKRIEGLNREIKALHNEIKKYQGGQAVSKMVIGSKEISDKRKTSSQDVSHTIENEKITLTIHVAI